jgi:transposase
MSIPIALVEDDRGSLIVPVPMPSSTACARAASGQRWTRRRCAPIRRRMIGFKRGPKRGCFFACGKQVLGALMNCAGSTGTGWRWTGRGPRRPWAGKQTGRTPTERGKSGGKRSLLTDGQGVPIGREVDGAHRHDMQLTRPTIESVVVERPAPTAERPQGMCLDAGSDYDEVYAILHEFGFTAHVRPRGEEAKALRHEAGFKARRWVVERAHSWMHRFRRLLIRWDKKPENCLALLHCASGLMAFRAAGLFG